MHAVTSAQTIQTLIKPKPYIALKQRLSNRMSPIISRAKPVRDAERTCLTHYSGLQRRASKIVYRNSGSLSTNDIIDKLGWKSLHQRREKHVLKVVQKCLDNEVPNYMSNYFKIRRNDIHDRGTRHCGDLVLDKVKVHFLTREQKFITIRNINTDRYIF